MKNTKKNKFALIIVLLLLLSSLLSVVEANNETQSSNNSLTKKIRLFERLRYRIRDTLGKYGGNNNELTNITGKIEYNWSFFKIGDVELHFGPDWYIKKAVSAYDYDKDGDKEIVFDEIMGLVESEKIVTVEGYLQTETWLSVFTINGLEYREAGKPIWAAEHKWQLRHRKNEGQGKLTLFLTDAPTELNITIANITISQVEVHKSGIDNNTGIWIAVVNEPQTFDLIALKDVKEFFGSKNLSAGWYTQIRLNIDRANITINNTEYEVKIPSEKVKIITPFLIEDNKTTNLTLDFDVQESIHKTGQNKYTMKPTIKLIQEE